MLPSIANIRFRYKKTEGKPQFAGFCTVYQYFWYKNHALHDNVPEPFTPNLRKRISQFVILPIYQGRGVGGGFYESLIDIFLADSSVKEISVEDPSEAFDDLRDRCDLSRLARTGEWAKFHDFEFDQDFVNTIREENKMTPRQFARCLEMALLPVAGRSDVTKKKYRILVKSRLYLRNKEPLDEMTTEEKKSKLQETYLALVDDYKRIIEKVDLSGKGKRISDDVQGEPATKKQKV